MHVQLFDDIPAVNILKEQTKSELRKLAKYAHIPKGTIIFRPGDKSEQFPFIAYIQGSMKINVLLRYLLNEIFPLLILKFILEV